MSDEMVLAPRVATEEMKLAGYSALIHVFEDEMCEPNPEDWGRAYASMIEAFDPITWKVARNQVIRELIEKIGPKASVYNYNRYGGGELEWDYNVSEWLKSQMEGE